MRKKSKKKFKGLLKKLSGVINLKELMSISLYGREIDKKLKIRSIKIFIRQFSRRQLIHQLGLTLKLRVTQTSLDLFSFLKEPTLINSTNSMKKNHRLNFLSKES